MLVLLAALGLALSWTAPASARQTDPATTGAAETEATALGTGALRDPDGPRLELVRQDAWIGPRGTFTFELRTDTPEAGYSIEARLLRAVDTVPGVLAGPEEAAGARSIGRIRFADPAEPEAGNVLPSLELGAGPETQTVSVPVVPDADGTAGNPFVLDPGVYPVLVQLFDPDGNEVDALVTHLVHLSAALGERPVPVAVVVDSRSPLHRDRDGDADIDVGDMRELRARLDALATFKTLPLALQVQPETVQAMTEHRGTEAGIALAALNRVAGAGSGAVQVLPSAFVAFDEAGWLADGAADLLRSELDAGVAALDAATLRRPEQVVILDRPGDPALLGRLFEFGYRNIIQPTEPTADAPVQFGAGPHLVTELPQQRVLPTPEHPFAPIAERAEGTSGPAADGAASRLGTIDAHRLLAALLVGPLNGDRATQQVRLGGDVELDGAFATSLLTALARSGAPLAPTSVADAFADDEHLAAPRTWNVSQPARPGATGGRAARLATTVAAVAGADSMVADPALLRSLEARLLLLPARTLDDATIDGLFAGIDTIVQGVRGAVVLPPDQAFSVTAHRTSLPLVLRNEGDIPLQVRLRFRSGELEFTGDNPATVTLQPGVNDLDIPIRTRRSGELEFTIDVTSPDGNLQVGQIDVRVLSRAISGVGVLLSAGALVFLIVWWIRNARRRRALARTKAAAAAARAATGAVPATARAPEAAESDGADDDRVGGDPSGRAAGTGANGGPETNGTHAPTPGTPGRR